mmetsp:Transcript_13211/g.21459  ORF Transcript_13211/g.21459 Transcript_13211/m.21459 type:complete len:191 (+) Transcript_13211:378-950(+)
MQSLTLVAFFALLSLGSSTVTDWTGDLAPEPNGGYFELLFTGSKHDVINVACGKNQATSLQIHSTESLTKNITLTVEKDAKYSPADSYIKIDTSSVNSSVTIDLVLGSCPTYRVDVAGVSASDAVTLNWNADLVQNTKHWKQVSHTAFDIFNAKNAHINFNGKITTYYLPFDTHLNNTVVSPACVETKNC